MRIFLFVTITIVLFSLSCLKTETKSYGADLNSARAICIKEALPMGNDRETLPKKKVTLAVRENKNETEHYFEITIPNHDKLYRLFVLDGDKVDCQECGEMRYPFHQTLAGRTFLKTAKEYKRRGMIKESRVLITTLDRRLAEMINKSRNFEVISLTGVEKSNYFDQDWLNFASLMDFSKSIIHDPGLAKEFFLKMREPMKQAFEAKYGPLMNYRDIYGSALLTYDLNSLTYDGVSVELPTTKHALVGRLYLDRGLPKPLQSYFYSRLIQAMESKNVEEVYIEVVDPAHRRLFTQRFGLTPWKEIQSAEYGKERVFIMRAPLKVVKEKFLGN